MIFYYRTQKHTSILLGIIGRVGVKPELLRRDGSVFNIAIAFLLHFWYNRIMVVSRMDKIDELVKNEISLQIRELFPDKIISVTQVHVSKDLSYAKVWVSSINNIDGVVKLCRSSSNEIRKNLSKKVNLRKVPKLHFVGDRTEEKAFEIEKLIKKIKE